MKTFFDLLSSVLVGAIFIGTSFGLGYGLDFLISIPSFTLTLGIVCGLAIGLPLLCIIGDSIKMTIKGL